MAIGPTTCSCRWRYGPGTLGAGVAAPTRRAPILLAVRQRHCHGRRRRRARNRTRRPGAVPLAGRTGNESRAAIAVSPVYRVLREPPPPPAAGRRFGSRVRDAGRLARAVLFFVPLAAAQPNLFAHVLRAMDESVFAAD